DFRLSVNRRLRTAFRFPTIGKRRARFDKNFPQVCKQTKIGNRKSKLANYPVCSREDVWRNIETDLIRCVQIDDEFKLYRLLYRQVRRLGAFEYFVDVNSSAPKQVSEVRSVRDKTTRRDRGFFVIHCRQSGVGYRIDDLF